MQSLTQARLSLNLSRRALARRASLSRQTVWRAEQGIPVFGITAQTLLAALNSVRAERDLPAWTMAEMDWHTGRYC